MNLTPNLFIVIYIYRNFRILDKKIHNVLYKENLIMTSAIIYAVSFNCFFRKTEMFRKVDLKLSEQSDLPKFIPCGIIVKLKVEE